MSIRGFWMLVPPDTEFPRRLRDRIGAAGWMKAFAYHHCYCYIAGILVAKVKHFKYCNVGKSQHFGRSDFFP